MREENMKKSKYVLMAIAGAAAVVAILALPASATTSAWLHEGEPLEESVELRPTGGEVVEFGGSVLICETSATITTEGGSTAQITDYDVNAASCAGVAGQVEGCEVEATTPKGLPWNVSVNSSDLTAEEVQVAYWFDGACPIGEIRTEFAELTLTPEEPSAIDLFRFSQEGTGLVDGKAAPIGYFGSLNLPEGELGTYGIG
jgi:hypothetical protein